MSKNIIYLAWDKINWTLVQKRVRRVQIRIYKAKQSNDISKMRWLQDLLIHSTDAKLLAIHKVTSFPKRLGEYNGKSLTHTQKLALVKKLHIDSKAHPIKKVWISKPGNAKRKPLEFAIIKDQAKQILCKLALEPEWEAVFEANSYGYRSTRKVTDAIQAIFISLNNKHPKWIFRADIRKDFDKIKYQTLIKKLNTFPLMEKQIESWLKAGILEGYANTDKHWIFPIVETSHGGIISQLLVNIALHGLESHLNNFIINLKKKSREVTKPLTFVRFADEFILIHSDQKILKLCIIEVNNWLDKIGLKLTIEKSNTKLGTLGFSFLGFQIIQVVKHNKYKAKITPSKNSQKLLLLKVRYIIQKSKAISSYQLIRKLRPIILEWGNYFKFCECTTIYKNLSHRIFLKLRAWVFRRDTRSARSTIKEKYFPNNKTWKFGNKIYKDNWVLYGKTRNKKNKVIENFLPHLSWISREKYIKINKL